MDYDRIKSMSDDDLRKIVSIETPLNRMTQWELSASMELQRREHERDKSIKRMRAVEKHEAFLVRIQNEGFQKPTNEQLRSLLYKTTHLALSNGDPDTFDLSEGWENPFIPGAFLRLSCNRFRKLITDRDFDDIGIIYKRQIYDGMISGNELILKGKDHDVADLYVDVVRFLRKEFLPA